MIVPEVAARVEKGDGLLVLGVLDADARSLVAVATATREGEILSVRRAATAARRGVFHLEGFGREIGGGATILAAIAGALSLRAPERRAHIRGPFRKSEVAIRRANPPTVARVGETARRADSPNASPPQRASHWRFRAPR